MYYPYFRGKQYDLITICENAELLAKANFVPLIEPVKEMLNGLIRAIDAVLAANGLVTCAVSFVELDDINASLDDLRSGRTVGRAVLRIS